MTRKEKTMPKYIDADALIADIKATIDGSGCVNHEGEILDCIEYAATADVVPVVRGEWTYEINECFRTCSVCRISQALLAGENLSRFKYCPFCGAKMEVKE